MIYAIIVFIFGLLVGSFLNCIVCRLRDKESVVLGHSKCPHCKKQLNWYMLVPILSYVFLKGRCKDCRKRISIQYPLVELITGICFLILFFRFSLSLSLLIYIVLTSFLIVIFIYDLKYYLILDKVSVMAIIVALLANIIIGQPWLDLFIGMAIGGVFFLLQYVISKGRWIGGGDIRLGIFMGAILGWQGVLVALFVAYMIGAFISVLLVIFTKKGMKSKIPFGTFLTVATYIAIVFGQDLINWYSNLIYL